MSPLTILGWTAALIYGLAMLCLVVYGLHTLWLLRVFARHEQAQRDLEAAEDATPLPSDDALPAVLVQVPVYNERDVVHRIVAAVGALEWPRDRLCIQLLDDSTDDSSHIGHEAIAGLRARGIDAHHVRRGSREGFKAGALEAGMARNDAPFIAIFDADFVPKPDFLRHAIKPMLTDRKLGLVQGRWEHLNRNANLLTRAQAMGIDAHFTVEQCARSADGLFMNFNGTCGLWRREAIVDAGGWEHETLTEDLDLSYRAQLRGWGCTYRLGLDVPGELPATVSAWRSQQFRWAKGSMQCARKLLPRVFRSERPLKAKIAAALHMTHYAVHPLMVISLIAAPVALWLCPTPPMSVLMFGLGAFLLGVFAPILTYIVSQLFLHRSRAWRHLAALPALAGIGTGIALSNGRAVYEAWRGVVSPFVRTPKQGETGGSYRAQGSSGIPELLAGLWACGGIALAANSGRPWVLPLLAIYASGFLWVGSKLVRVWLRERWSVSRRDEHAPSAWALLGLGTTMAVACTALGMSTETWQQRPIFFAGLGLVIGALFLLGCAVVRRRSLGPWAFTAILVTGLAMRIGALGMTPSDDLNRYVVEGRQMAYGINPYATAPADPHTEHTLRGVLDGRILDAVNHSEWTAIYPPTSLATHMVVTHIDSRVETMRLFYAGVEVATMLVLLALLLKLGLPAALWLLAWWNPIGPLWFAGEGHNDALMALWIVGGLYLLAHGHRRGSLVAMSIAALAKPFAALAMLPQLRRASWRLWLLPPAIAVLAYIPFLGAGTGVFSSLGRFGGELHFHGALEPLIRLAYTPFLSDAWLRPAVVTSLLALLILGTVWVLWRERGERDVYTTTARLLALLLLCLPTLHPWYLMLLVPLIPLMRRPLGALLWCAMAPVYWLHGLTMLEQGGAWAEDLAVTIIAHLPAVLLLAWDLRPHRWLGHRSELELAGGSRGS
ncbi:MAG: glycosyltransferase [Planctomycetota bacterium]|jgi:cellulose synthase/poly-beta-1,6-N-acetylglucosamine synthase-like glycosyltransferase|nr:glycosyltransferase [Planctomycetota bacterium]